METPERARNVGRKSRRVAVTVTEAEHEELTERAREAGVTLALMVRMALGIEGATAEGEGSGDE